MTDTQERKSYNLEIDNIQLLKEYKELLDSGIISQEEFNVKKNELLNFSRQKNIEQPAKVEPLAQAEQTNLEKSKEYFTCKKCGRALSSSQKVCSYCLTSWPESPKEKVRGMKWHKFLVNFYLIALGIMYILNALSSIMSTAPSELGLSDLRAVNVVYGIICIGLGIMAFKTRSALSWSKAKGPNLLYTFYALETAVYVLYAIAFWYVSDDLILQVANDIMYNISGEFTSNIVVGLVMILYLFAFIVGRLIFIALHYHYYKNRKELFVH